MAKGAWALASSAFSVILKELNPRVYVIVRGKPEIEESALKFFISCKTTSGLNYYLKKFNDGKI